MNSTGQIMQRIINCKRKNDKELRRLKRRERLKEVRRG